ncbi:MAG TPA: HisS family protein, partial [Gemmatales bacterium]|nr:HisS family protein [Gemmatales bacterium]
IHLNHRQILTGVVAAFGLAEQTAPLLRALDKLPKAGREAVAAEMCAKAGATPGQADQLLDLCTLTGTNEELLAAVLEAHGDQPATAAGVARLTELLQVAQAAGLPPERLRLDLAIARGLDYYTGTIYETFLTDLPEVGSVCSGGRYDNLASLYTRQVIPGVGASLGLDRLLAALEQLKLLATTATTAPVLLVQFAAAHLGAYQALARQLRAAGVGVELFPEPKKIGAQLSYASKRGHRFALIAGPDDFAREVWQLKELATGTSRELAAANVVAQVAAAVAQDA